MNKRSIFDKVLLAVAPGVAAERGKNRLRALQYEKANQILDGHRAYDAAGSGRRTEGWKRVGTSANSEIAVGGQKLRFGSRELIRNNPWAKKAQRVITTRVVGKGITPQIRVLNKKDYDRLKNAWQNWGETTECDYFGKLNFYGLERLAMDAVVESGAVFVQKINIASNIKATIPLKIKVLESDFLDRTRNGIIEGKTVRDGIAFDDSGRVLGYWLYFNHPGDNAMFVRFAKNASYYAPASEVIHVYRIDRPGQIDGVPWSHAVALKLRDLDDAHDAYLLRQKIAACFTAFVYDDEGGGGGSEKSVLPETMEPGLIQMLPTGKQVSFATPPGVEGFSEFSDDELHAIAAGYGITFASLTTKLSGLNYLSGRLGELDMGKNIDEWQTLMFIPQFCDPLFAWFLQGCMLRGFGNPNTAWAQWVTPTRDMVDPDKEFKVSNNRVRSGGSLFDFMRAQGDSDPEDTIRRKAEENALLDKYGIILDSDPRRTTNAGNAVVPGKPQDDQNAGDTASGGQNSDNSME